ncbi:hypothetical protein D3C72_1890570 [compost metagenome]
MVDECGDQNAQNDRPGFAKACGEHQRKQLRLVAHFGERNDGGGDKKRFHVGEVLSGRMGGKRIDCTPTPAFVDRHAVNGLAQFKNRIRHRF